MTEWASSSVYEPLVREADRLVGCAYAQDVPEDQRTQFLLQALNTLEKCPQQPQRDYIQGDVTSYYMVKLMLEVDLKLQLGDTGAVLLLTEDLIARELPHYMSVAFFQGDCWDILSR